MSFSLNVKNEIINIINNRHCAIAEFAAYFNFISKFKIKDDLKCLVFFSENEMIINKCKMLINYIFLEKVEIIKYKYFEININNQTLINNIINTIYLNGDFNNLIVKSICCKRAYIRGSFISTGYISNPNKNYHLEFSNITLNQGELLKEILTFFDISAKIIQKKDTYIIYIKEGEQIVDLLNIIEAHKSLLVFENIRIFKDVRNNINRIVNCEMANLNKVVLNAIKQKEDILFIKEKVGLDYLPKQLKEVAYLRLNYPEASLKELGEMLEPNISKSGVNHRLKKINKIAQDLRRY